MQTGLRLAKNATANLMRGGVAGIIAIFLPAVLVRHMSQMEYTVWVLVLQIAAYSSYLDFGLQTAVGRYTAIADENGDADFRDAIFSTAFVGLALAGLLAMTALVMISLAAGLLFPQISLEWLGPMRACILIVGSSIALGLPSSAWNGVFIGMQRNELVAAVVGGFRIISAAVLVMAAIHHAHIVSMACLVAAVNLASYLVSYFLAKHYTTLRFQFDLIRSRVARDLSTYCFSLTIWSLSMLLVSGLDLILVGRFEIAALVPYSLATSLVSFIGGVQAAVFTAMMAHAAVLYTRRETAALGLMVIRTTQLAAGLLVMIALPVLIYAVPLLNVWVGTRYSLQGRNFLVILMAANVVRLLGTPYSIVLVATGQQKLVILSPLLEGATNLVASVVLGSRFGAIGVAMGTLVGGVIGMLGHIFYNVPRTRCEVGFSQRTYLVSALGRPFLASMPLISFCVYTYLKPSFSNYSFGAVAIATAMCFAWIALSQRRSSNAELVAS